MTDELNKLLIKAYYCYKDYKNPPVPVNTIKEFLELEGIKVEDRIDRIVAK